MAMNKYSGKISLYFQHLNTSPEFWKNIAKSLQYVRITARKEDS